jgi:DNA-binding winged helix-turn-helix (wHTH) protein
LATGYRLGEWTVRPHRNQIERGNETVHLAPKTMAVLDCLAKASNSVVTRQQIFDSVWPGAVVSDETLTQRISELRKAFGDTAHESLFIETIPKTGFRLVPPVVPLPDENERLASIQPVPGAKRAFMWLALVAAALLVAALSVNRFLPVKPAIQESATR